MEAKKLQIIPEEINIEDPESYTLCIKMKCHGKDIHYNVYSDFPDYKDPIDEKKGDPWAMLRSDGEGNPTMTDLEIFHLARGIGQVLQEKIAPNNLELRDYVTMEIIKTIYKRKDEVKK